MKTFKALVVRNGGDCYTSAVEERTIDSLPDGEVLINVQFSSINFKDILVMSGARGLTKEYPHTPGIDAAGTITESNDSRFKTGDEVFVTGFKLGVTISGGFSEYIRVPGDWVQKVPEGMTVKEIMVYGTAGLAAAMSVNEIVENGISPDAGEILVTGASGGVGSLTVSMLVTAGYSVVAGTNRDSDKDRLLNMGVSSIIGAEELVDTTGKQLLKTRWAGVIDVVGGKVLSTAIASTDYRGVVTNCGMVAGNEMTVSVFPFLIRGVRLVGIDTVLCPIEIRDEVWKKIATQWKSKDLDLVYSEVALDQIDGALSHMKDGTSNGRWIVAV